ncbi:MAG: FAD-dependent monooxygenase [Thermomicrobiales bacterium]|nr:FAD-dependent monooxygenase [Thermomicrobiales bacterium]
MHESDPIELLPTGEPASAAPVANPDVLVVGAGPVGLALAVELARRGIPHRLIDRNTDPTTHSRALGTQARTVEVLGLMGIPESALEPAVHITAFTVLDGRESLARIEIDIRAPDRFFDGLLVMTQGDTERVLGERLTALGGRIERGVSLVGLAQNGAGIVAELQTPEGTEAARPRFVVGCDGAGSTVRRRLGLEFAGDIYPQEFLLADCRIDWERPRNEGFAWVHPGGLFATLPLPDPGYWRIVVASAVSDDASEQLSLECFARIFAERTGQSPTLTDARWMSRFRINHRMADHFSVGRVFLAGDAAHVHSPLGAQGMNTGIQDSFNLGWKLALAARGHAAPGLLDTYSEERAPVARAVVDATDRGMRLVMAANPALRWVRDRVVTRVANRQLGRAILAEAISQLSVNYRRSSLSVGERRGFDSASPRPGDRAPFAGALLLPEETPIDLGVFMAEGSWTLLLFADPARPLASASEHAALAARIVESLGDLVRPLIVLQRGAPPEPRAWSTPTLLDSRDELRARYGVEGEAVALIRPDGYIGYRAAPVRDQPLWAYLGRVFHPELLPAAG